jgi:hypothetical protein
MNLVAYSTLIDAQAPKFTLLPFVRQLVLFGFSEMLL